MTTLTAVILSQSTARITGRFMRLSATCLSLLALSPYAALAQGEISGRVVTSDSGRPAVPGAEASIPKLRLTATSDSAGRFRLKNLPPGQHVVWLRAIGFRAESSLVTIDFDEVVSWDIALTRTTVLPERIVTAPGTSAVPAHLVEFMERKQAGVGHFLSRDEIAKAEGGFRQTGDLVSLIPGVVARRGSNKIWIASGRAISTSCAFCKMSVSDLNRADIAAGARPACFMDVYLNGAMVYDSRHPENGLFDVNSVPPEHIGGIEVYSSAAQIPAKYNRTGAGCGVMLIWTR